MDIFLLHCGPLDEMFYYATLDCDEILELDDVDEQKKPSLDPFHSHFSKYRLCFFSISPLIS